MYAIIVHKGANHAGGHYIAFVCNAPGKWFMCSDTMVTQVRAGGCNTVMLVAEGTFVVHTMNGGDKTTYSL